MLLSLRLSLSAVIPVSTSGWMLGQWRRLSNLYLPCPDFFSPRYPILDNVAVNFAAGITNLVGNSPFLLILLWYLMIFLETGFFALQTILSYIVTLELINQSYLFKFIH